MRSRAQSTEHAETVTRRLRLLSAELNGIRPLEPDDDGDHTHLRELRPVSDDASPDDAADRSLALPSESVTGVPSTAPSRIVEVHPGAGPAPIVAAPGRHAARRRTGPAWIDLSAFRGRVALAPAHVAVLAVLVAVGLGVTAWWVIRDDPGTPVTAPSGGPALTTPVDVSGAPVPGDLGRPVATTEVVVDVAGKVRRPGIVVLPPGSRVVDAIKASGGVKKGADLRGLNQARLLLDGEQIVVGVPAPPGVAASSAAQPGSDAGELISLNTATSTELEELPGVGPVTAEAIVTWREGNGGFASVDQLLEVDGIGEKTLAQLAPHVTL